MKRRPPPPPPSGLPAELAAGPRSFEHDDMVEWTRRGTEWSKANGYSWNGWLSLLPPEVREATSARARLRRMDLL